MAVDALPLHRSFRQIFGVPILLAIVTAAGLLSALLGDGVWNALSWFALSIPVAMIIFYVSRPARNLTTSAATGGFRLPHRVKGDSRRVPPRKGAR